MHVPEVLVISPKTFVIQAAAFKVRGENRPKNIKMNIQREIKL